MSRLTREHADAIRSLVQYMDMRYRDDVAFRNLTHNGTRRLALEAAMCIAEQAASAECVDAPEHAATGAISAPS